MGHPDRTEGVTSHEVGVIGFVADDDGVAHATKLMRFMRDQMSVIPAPGQ